MTKNGLPYFYRVGYGTYEESEFFFLMHEEKLDLKEEIKKVIPRAMELLQNEGTFGFGIANHSSFQDLNRHIVAALVELRGFTVLEPDEEFTYFGWNHLKQSKAWAYETDDNDELIYDALEEAGWTEAQLNEVAALNDVAIQENLDKWEEEKSNDS